jgi:nitrilase
MKILACQIDIPFVNSGPARDAHIARVAELIAAKLRDEPADLVLLPELSTMAYSKDSFLLLDALAEPLEGPTFQVFSQLAQEFDVFICFGIAREGGRGRYISQVVVDPEGFYAGHYDKLHLAQFGNSMEKYYFVPGNHLLVFEVGEVRVAPLICYDMRFPELARTLCLRNGVDVLLHSVAFSNDATEYTWHKFVTTRAVENQVFFLSLNRAGQDYGGSFFCPPWVGPKVTETIFPKGEFLAVIEVDADRIAETREEYPYRADKLDNYHLLKVNEVL